MSSDYIRRVNESQVGKRVSAVDGSWKDGVITGGDLYVGLWTVRHPDGTVTTEKGPDMMSETP